jgi:hypothetical protein
MVRIRKVSLATLLLLLASCGESKQENGGVDKPAERDRAAEVAVRKAPPGRSESSFAKKLVERIPAEMKPLHIPPAVDDVLAVDQIQVTLTDGSRAYWHLKDWGQVDRAEQVLAGAGGAASRSAAALAGAVGSAPGAERVTFRARFGAIVLTGSAPSAELDSVRKMLRADAFALSAK